MNMKAIVVLSEAVRGQTTWFPVFVARRALGVEGGCIC